MSNFERIFTKLRKHRDPEPTSYEIRRNADKSITIRQDNRDGTFSPERTFAVGDDAEYDSYNFSYYAKIIKISPKTITIEGDYKNHRLSLEVFAWRNYDFDINKAIERNQEVSYSI